MDTYDRYRRALLDTWNQWWVTWPLSRKVAIGEVYDVSGTAVRSAGSLTDQGISWELSPGSVTSSFTYDSGGSASVRFKIAGDSPPGFEMIAKAEAGALVEFKNDSSVLIIYRELSQSGLRNTYALASTLVEQYWKGRWQEDFVAVTDLVSAGQGIVLAAAGKEASAEFRLGISAEGPITLGDLTSSASVVRRQHIGLEWIGKDTTPLFHVVRIQKTWLAKIKVEYGPPQLGRQALPIPVPKLILEQAQDSPADILERLHSSEQPLWGEEKP